MELHAFSSRKKLDDALLQTVVKSIKTKYSKNSQYSIALSGGNTPKSFYQQLGTYLERNPELADFVVLFQVDERLVPIESDRSNQKMVRSYFSEAVSFHPFPVNLQKERSREFEESCAGLISSNLDLEGSKISFDCVILGMGEDGHTASLFPNEEVYLSSLVNEDKSIVVTHPDNLEPRVSLTASTINNSRLRVLLFTGPSKSKVFVEALKSGDPQQYPIFSVIRNGLKVYTDLNPELLQIGDKWSLPSR